MVMIVLATSTILLSLSACSVLPLSHGKDLKEKALTVAQFMERDMIASMTEGEPLDRDFASSTFIDKAYSQFDDISHWEIRLTRLKPRMVQNAPDRYEITQMQIMEADSQIKESFSNEAVDGDWVYRFMYPLYFDESCLTCHGGTKGESDITGYTKEGASAGEFAGAISIILK
jgi:hypothetical protein